MSCPFLLLRDTTVIGVFGGNRENQARRQTREEKERAFLAKCMCKKVVVVLSSLTNTPAATGEPRRRRQYHRTVEMYFPPLLKNRGKDSDNPNVGCRSRPSFAFPRSATTSSCYREEPVFLPAWEPTITRDSFVSRPTGGIFHWFMPIKSREIREKEERKCCIIWERVVKNVRQVTFPDQAS